MSMTFMALFKDLEKPYINALPLYKQQLYLNVGF